MARRNFVRSWLAASLLAVPVAVGLSVGTSPAAAADERCLEGVTHVVTVRDDGFSQTDIDAQVDDLLAFRLDDAAIQSHTLAWERGSLEYRFSRRFGRTCVRYGPLRAGTLHFYDSSQLAGDGPHPPGPFAGTLTISEAPRPSSSSSTTTSSTSTTVTTMATSSTTTTLPPSTTTTAPGTIRPFLIPDQQPMSTTTAAPAAAPPSTGERAAPAGDKDKDKAKDKGKSTAAATETPATATAAPPDAAPLETIFDPASLTPGPTTLPEPLAGSALSDETALGVAAVADLLHPETEDPAGSRVGLYVLGALASVFVVGGIWGWQHRSSRYFPA